jgi:hypothetical protein
MSVEQLAGFLNRPLDEVRSFLGRRYASDHDNR